MFLIVAHHYVVNSGLIQLLETTQISMTTIAMTLFGAWGKTGINCFLLITGYFMCKSDFSWQKLLKLYLQITLYAVVVYIIFCVTGRLKISLVSAIRKLLPIWGFHSNFTSCFLMFYLFIPFLNILIKNINRNQHLILMILLLIFYSILPTVPGFQMAFNYVSWFMAIYIIAAYIRIYQPLSVISTKSWGWLSLMLIVIGSISVVGMDYIFKMGYINSYAPYYFVADSNKLLSILIAIASFMFFKNINIPHSKLINAVGGATFGVLLIHANSDAMRQWLWKDTIDCVGNFKEDVIYTLGYASVSVLLIFIICAGIDWFRGKYIEPHLLRAVNRMFSPIATKIYNSLHHKI